jgi:glutamate racemase
LKIGGGTVIWPGYPTHYYVKFLNRQVPKVSPDAPIGIFDSGPGGLAVLREIRRLLPHEDILYLADTARQPYGPRASADVRTFAVELTRYLARQGVKMVIIACNTASASGLEAARRAVPGVSVLGMIRPGVRAALAVSRGKRLGNGHHGQLAAVRPTHQPGES